jgi:hypothetical protein
MQTSSRKLRLYSREREKKRLSASLPLYFNRDGAMDALNYLLEIGPHQDCARSRIQRRTKLLCDENTVDKHDLAFDENSVTVDKHSMTFEEHNDEFSARYLAKLVR